MGKINVEELTPLIPPRSMTPIFYDVMNIASFICISFLIYSIVNMIVVLIKRRKDSSLKLPIKGLLIAIVGLIICLILRNVVPEDILRNAL